MNRFDKLHEGRRAHDRDGFRDIRTEVHAAQAAAQSLFGEYLAFGTVFAKAHDGGDVAHVPAFLEHQHGDDSFIRAGPRIYLVGLLAQQFQLLLVLARGGLGDFTVVLGMDDKHRPLQLGTGLLQVRTDLVAVPGVVHHDKQDRFLA